MKKGILINAEDRTITEVEVNDNIAELIGVRTFACVDITETETAFVDEEGLLNSPQHFITLEGYHDPLAGNALILGFEYETAESVDTRLSLAEVKRLVKFHSRKEIVAMYV